MSISFNCECGKPLKSKEEMAGRKTRCPHCGAILTIPGSPSKLAASPLAKAEAAASHPAHPDALRVEGLDWSNHDPVANLATPDPPPTIPSMTSISVAGSGSASGAGSGSGFDPSKRPDVPRPDDGSKQYKVLGQRDHSASGKLNFASMEAALNEQAHLGWVMKAAFVVNVPGHAGNHDEVVLILER